LDISAEKLVGDKAMKNYTISILMLINIV